MLEPNKNHPNFLASLPPSHSQHRHQLVQKPGNRLKATNTPRLVIACFSRRPPAEISLLPPFPTIPPPTDFLISVTPPPPPPCGTPPDCLGGAASRFCGVLLPRHPPLTRLKPLPPADPELQAKTCFRPLTYPLETDPALGRPGCRGGGARKRLQLQSKPKSFKAKPYDIP